MKIDWNKMIQHKASIEATFESLWHHIVRVMFKTSGIFIDGYNMPGSEFFVKITSTKVFEGVKLDVGDEIGWQCKYWLGLRTIENTPLNREHIEELVEGFKKTVKVVPNLKVWVVCTPGMCKYEQKIKLEEKIKEYKDAVTIIYWNKETLEGLFLEKDSIYTTAIKYYFNKGINIFKLIQEYSKITLETLRNKYDTDLHQPSMLETDYLMFSDTEKAENYVKEMVTKYKKELSKKEEPENYYKEDKEKFVCQNILIKVWWKFYEVINKLLAVLDKSDVDIRSRAYNSLRIIETEKSEINFFIKEYSNIYEILSPYDTNKVQELYQILNGKKIGLKGIIPVVKIISGQFLHILSPAGGGKTHFCCSVVEKLLSNNKPVLFFKGASFKYDQTALNTFGCLLGLSEYNYIDFFDQLEFVGEQYNDFVTIVIDGLNESRLSKEGNSWEDELKSISFEIKKRKHIRLITSCRDNEEYIKRVYGCDIKENVPNSIEIYGFEEKNIKEVIEKYFKKYDIKILNSYDFNLLKHPLSLKMFCEANKGKTLRDLTNISLTECFETYINKLLDSICCSYGDNIGRTKYKLIKYINEISIYLWNNNLRDVSLYETFDEFFQEYADKVIDEGLFTKNIESKEERVQFSYDRMAGFCIAKAVINEKTKDELLDWLVTEVANEKLLNIESKNRHPLAEDICFSLFYLFHKEYNQNIFELIDSEWLNVQSLIYLMDAGYEHHKFFDDVTITPILAKTFLNILSDKTLHRKYMRNYQLSRIFVRIPLVWLDIYWYMRMDFYDVHMELNSLLKRQKSFNEDFFCLYIFMSGTFKTKQRCQYIEGAINLALFDVKSALSIIEKFIVSYDYSIIENLFLIMLGVIFRIDDKKTSERFINTMFLLFTKKESTNAVIIDCIDTACAINNYRYDSSYILPKINPRKFVEADLNNISVDDYINYDFLKHNIRPYCYNCSDYWSNESNIKRIVIKIMQDQGFLPSIYIDACEINKEQMPSINTYNLYEKCVNKSARSAMLEVLGWMIINDIVSSEYVETMRTNEQFYDPSYIPITPKQLFFHNSLLCHNGNFSEWVNSSPFESIKSILSTRIKGFDDDMILIYCHLIQSTDLNEQKLYININSRINESDYELSTCHNNKFIGEIGWRKMEKPDEITPIVPLVTEYSFTSWDSSTREDTYNIMYLSDIYAVAIGLHFDFKCKNWYTNEGIQVTKFFYSDSSQFLFIRKKYLDLILEKFKYSYSRSFFASKQYIDKKSEKRFYKNYREDNILIS